jgi:predicted lipoprotein with Yx(FWY)xxD motif
MSNRFMGAAMLAAALIVGACAGGAGTTPRPATPAPATPGAATPSPTASGSEGPTTGATVQLAASEFGDIVVDGAGRTLYAFTPDSDGTPTCNGDCAGNWPALLATDEVTVGEGLDDSDFTTVARTDGGGDQVKFGNWPLYYFAGDSAAGDVNGQGVGDKWFVVGADGEMITE